jgi:hypothetical protein
MLPLDTEFFAAFREGSAVNRKTLRVNIRQPSFFHEEST